MAKIVKCGLVLCTITFVSAFLLGFLNNITEDVVAKNVEIMRNNSMKLALSGVEGLEFEEAVEINESFLNYYTEAKRGDETYGYVFNAVSPGYSGNIELMIGISNEGEITGVEIVSHSETPGLGANAKEDKFKNQYIGKAGELAVVKAGVTPRENEIQAITSATITTNTITKAVNAVSVYFETGLGGAGQ